ncbi:MAG: ABC transporter permease [Anaerolineae bacterium]|nr:ABC transporter permease [Anaerolineae bacterium]
MSENTEHLSFVSRIRQILLSPIVGPLVALLAASLFFATRTERFLSGANISLIFQQSGWIAVLAIGQTLIILTAGIDLSNGAVMTLGSVVMVNIAAHNGVNPYVAVLIGFLITGGFGLLNGLLVTQLRLPPFIVTLGTLNVAFALTLIYTVETVVAPSEQTIFGQIFRLGGTVITYGTVAMLLLFLLMWFILRETPFGRHIYALGNNPEAARLTGIRTDRLLIAVYTLAGLIYGFAGLILIGRTGVGDPNAAQTANLDSITAVVLGGTSLFGGRGNVLGTLIGSLIVGVFRNGLQLMGIPSIYQVLITGILVILAVAVDQLSQRAKR